MTSSKAVVRGQQKDQHQVYSRVLACQKVTVISAKIFSSSNLQDLSKGIKMIAGLLDDGDDGKNLLDATRGLAGAFSALLKAAQEGGGADSEVRIII